jgi:hypothetical protein
MTSSLCYEITLIYHPPREEIKAHNDMAKISVDRDAAIDKDKAKKITF